MNSPVSTLVRTCAEVRTNRASQTRKKLLLAPCSNSRGGMLSLLKDRGPNPLTVWWALEDDRELPHTVIDKLHLPV